MITEQAAPAARQGPYPIPLEEVGLSVAEYDHLLSLLGRTPTPVELGMVGAMWSEHCGYKNSRPLLRLFPTQGPRVLQGPGENAGAVDIGDRHFVLCKHLLFLSAQV